MTYEIRFVISAILALIVVVLGANAVLSIENEPETSLLKATAESVSFPDPFDDLVLEAKAAYVWDSARGVELFSKNAEAQLPLASLTKLMTALVAFDLLPDNATVTISRDVISTEGDSGLSEGETWFLEDLIGFTLMISSNDGAAALASAAGALKSADPLDPEKNRKRFVSLMNEKAGELGLLQTYFTNETGLDILSRLSGGYGSAHDVTHLMVYILETTPTLLEATQYAERTFSAESGLLYKAQNTNVALHEIPAPLGGKTGFTDLALGNLTIAFDAGIGYPIIITVLGSSEQGRFHDVIKLIEASLISIAQK